MHRPVLSLVLSFVALSSLEGTAQAACTWNGSYPDLLRCMNNQLDTMEGQLVQANARIATLESECVTSADLASYATLADLDGYVTTADLAGYATTADLASYALSSDLDSYVLDTDLDAYATTSDLAAYATTSDLAGYATTSDLDAYATTSDLAAYATTSDLAAYATTSDLASYALAADLDGYATTTDLASYALAADLDGYATTTDLASYALLTDLDVYAESSDLASYALTTDLASYALSSDLDAYALSSDLSGYALSSDLDAYATSAELTAVDDRVTVLEGFHFAKRVFITEASYAITDFDGAAGADALCQADADAAGLDGTFAAWIADTTVPTGPLDTFTHSPYPYELVDGTRIADDWDDLVDGELQNGIDLDAYGVVTSETRVWSAVNADGSNNIYSCVNWTNTATTTKGGIVGSTTDWTDGVNFGCGVTQGLYCFEQ